MVIGECAIGQIVRSASGGTVMTIISIILDDPQCKYKKTFPLIHRWHHVTVRQFLHEGKRPIVEDFKITLTRFDCRCSQIDY